jgi:hypothetical protein
LARIGHARAASSNGGAMSHRGVHRVVCSTCLNYFKLADQQQIGIVGSIADIVEAQWRADKVITL